ncbi:MAG: OmpA family protein [Candidatus Korobacteraceae bacterium]|jgi:outer membrane protein OmpA-like peptidoglycan-associated protein
MKISMLFTLPLAAALVLPAVAQQTTSDDQQPAASSAASSSPSSQSSSQTAQTTQDANSDQNMSARQPLQPEVRQGFWGKMNPFARKKYVQRQLQPIRDRTNELDDLTAENARQIKDVDGRAQEGIRQADARATQADQHATDAGNRAQQANDTATQASNRLNTVEQVVGNIDQYQPATQAEIRFRSGQTVLSRKDRQALDDMTADLKDQKGYIIEVQGFSTGAGQYGIQNSQAMANSVVRYLVEKNEIPVYRVFVMGLGNAKLPAQDGSTAQAHGNRVEISLLKNSVDQLASAAPPNGEMSAGMGDEDSGYSTQSSQPQSAPMQPQSSDNTPQR